MEFDNLVTSPFGLGQRLIYELLKRGETVFTLFASPKDVPMSFLGKQNLKYNFLKFDQRMNIERSLPKKVKYIFHLYENYTGYFPEMFFANTVTTLLLLDWAKKVGVRKFIYLSSGEVYGDGEGLNEDRPLAPGSFYALTKFEAELLLKYYHNLFEIKTVRLFFPFGRNVKNTLISKLFDSVNSGKEIIIEYQTISPTFIDDVVEPLIGLRETTENAVFNICGDCVNIKDFVAMAAGLNPDKPIKINCKNKVLCGDSSRAKKMLKYQATPIEEAIRKLF